MSTFINNSGETEPNSWVALWDHQPENENEDELSFRAGDIIKVIDKEHDDWWLGSLDGKTGLFPVTYGQLTGTRYVDSDDIVTADSKSLNDHISERPGRFYFSEPLYPLSLPENTENVTEVSSKQHQSYLRMPEIIDPFKTPNGSQISLPINENVSSPPWNNLPTEADLEASESITSGETDHLNELLGEVQLNDYEGNEEIEDDENFELNDSAPLAQITTVSTIDSSLGFNLNKDLIAKQGLLSIKSSVSDFGPLTSTKHWKQYHVTLYSNYLLIFRAEERGESGRLKGYFNLKDCKLELDNDKLSKKKLVFALHLKSSLKPIFLADTVTNFNSWVESIRKQVISLKDGSITDNPDFLPSLRKAVLGVAKSKSHRRSLSLSKDNIPTISSLDNGEPSKSNKKNIVTKLFAKGNSTTISNSATAGFWYSLATIGGSNVSYVVTKCIESLHSKKCLDSEGIYRLSGNNTTVKMWKDKFSKGLVENFDEKDINVITSLLKLYLRELHQPLLPPNLYNDLTEASRIQDYDTRLIQQKTIIQSAMSPTSLATLHYLITHLAEITELSHVNKMDPGNVAIVFAPTLARQPEKEINVSTIPNLKVFHNLIETMLIQSKWFFEADEVEEAEEVDHSNNDL